MAASPHTLAFTLVSVERGRLGADPTYPWSSHDTVAAINDLGTAVWVKFTVNSIISLCRFVYVVAGEELLTTQTATVTDTSLWAAAADQFTVSKGGNTATGGAGLVPICGVNSTGYTLSIGAFGWIQTHGPVLAGPLIGSTAVVAQETQLNAPAKADKGGAVVHTNTHTQPPFATVTTTETATVPAVMLHCSVF